MTTITLGTWDVGEGNGTPLQYSCLENPWTEEPGRLQSMGSLRVGHDWAASLSLFTFMHWRRKWQPTPVFLPRESQGRGSVVGCRLWGPTESDMTEETAAAATWDVILNPTIHLSSAHDCRGRESTMKWVRSNPCPWGNQYILCDVLPVPGIMLGTGAFGLALSLPETRGWI